MQVPQPFIDYKSQLPFLPAISCFFPGAINSNSVCACLRARKGALNLPRILETLPSDPLPNERLACNTNVRVTVLFLGPAANLVVEAPFTGSFLHFPST